MKITEDMKQKFTDRIICDILAHADILEQEELEKVIYELIDYLEIERKLELLDSLKKSSLVNSIGVEE
jgi:hypothetical protein